MKVSTLIHNHFTIQALRKAVKAIAIYNEDGSEVLELTTVLTHESLDICLVPTRESSTGT